MPAGEWFRIPIFNFNVASFIYALWKTIFPKKIIRDWIDYITEANAEKLFCEGKLKYE